MTEDKLRDANNVGSHKRIEDLLAQRRNCIRMISAQEDQKNPDLESINDMLINIQTIDGKLDRFDAKPRKANKNDFLYKDSNIDACFDVKKLAGAFLDQIDYIAKSNIEEDAKIDSDGIQNVCMVGIFAPWGRGKSYFFKQIKKLIKTRNEKNVEYSIVEFNAWKYQETPAIWAYLFEAIYSSRNRRFKLSYTLFSRWESILSDLMIFALPFIFIVLTPEELLKDWKIPSVVLGVVGFGINFLKTHYDSAVTLIKKCSKGISFSKELGIQAEIEKEITSLLNFWIKRKSTNKQKVILYVDDIDRCSETKMVAIIESLRTVLENDEIRKRLIIICSIDPKKLMLGIKHKYKELYSNSNSDVLEALSIEQMDKLFLTGFALNKLSENDLMDFVGALLKTNDEHAHRTSENKTMSNTQGQYEDQSLKHLELDIEMKPISEVDINNWINEFILEYKYDITPRRLRIIYYRIWFANNIIAHDNESEFPKELAKNIFLLSIGNNNIENVNTNYENILKMVVPYHNNEY